MWLFRELATDTKKRGFRPPEARNVPLTKPFELGGPCQKGWRLHDPLHTTAHWFSAVIPYVKL